MKYFSLDNKEFKELINLRKASILSFLLVFAFLVVVVLFISNSIFGKSMLLSPLAIVTIFTVSSIIFIFLTNKDYVYDLIKKEKKVYKGVLSIKSYKESSKKFHFNIDGNIFVIDKETYEKYEEGEILEIHISPFTKHLFKIEKVA